MLRTVGRWLTFTPRVMRIALVTSLVGLWVIVPSGAAVRLTASGLGCSDWPTCENGDVVPATSAHALIESTNRLLSAVIMLIALAAFIITWRTPGSGRTIRIWAGAAAICTIAQIPLGAITVMTDLHPLAVGSHFLLSMVALGAAAVAAVLAFDRVAGRRRRMDRRQGPLALLAGLAGAATLVTGVLVTAAGPHSGDEDVLRRYGHLADAAHLHVRVAVVFLVISAAVAAWLWWERAAEPLAMWLAAVTLPLLALQIGIGEYQYRNHLPAEVVGVHVSLAALVWAGIVGIVVSVAWPRVPVAEARTAPRMAVPPPAASVPAEPRA